MKKSQTVLKKSLRLSSEKIRQLQASELTAADGGSSNGCTVTGSLGPGTLCHVCNF